MHKFQLQIQSHLSMRSDQTFPWMISTHWLHWQDFGPINREGGFFFTQPRYCRSTDFCTGSTLSISYNMLHKNKSLQGIYSHQKNSQDRTNHSIHVRLTNLFPYGLGSSEIYWTTHFQKFVDLQDQVRNLPDLAALTYKGRHQEFISPKSSTAMVQ